MEGRVKQRVGADHESVDVERHARQDWLTAMRYSVYVLAVLALLAGFSGAAVAVGYEELRPLMVSSGLAVAMLVIARYVWRRGGGSDLDGG